MVQKENKYCNKYREKEDERKLTLAYYSILCVYKKDKNACAYKMKCIVYTMSVEQGV